ncbi:MAG TPA: tetratricopeptide repeat protein [Candidatus Acidoferrum sp.]|nr:tetratricopeptide repeat protein [Candidatus Acidoferrum sp.]
MTTTTVTRRLAAILAADVVGYSRLMGADEEGTHERVKEHLREVVDPKIREHHGRIVKTTGDGVLAEFASVVDAVRCAGQIQRAMAARDLDLAEERRLRFRIGVNLGDVIADGGDIYGDGVNIAVRLEGLAAPGGICVSGTVRDHIGDRLPYAFEDMGEQNVKNIVRPVRVYAVRPEGMAGSPTASLSSTTSGSPPVAAPRLSIVVLPFANLSDDREQQYFADGITEDVTTDLSRIADMFVISRNTAFTYRNKPVDTKQIGRELGVRYVLEGSVRRSGNQIRVTTQLIDAETDAHLWAERFDRDTLDLFALQNEITSRIAVALHLELIGAEAARPIADLDALDYILRGRATWLKPRSRDNYAEEIRLFARALALDPGSAQAQSLLAGALAGRVLDQMSDVAAADIARAEGLIAESVASSPRSYLAHLAKGQVLRAQGRYKEAISEYETVLALNRNAVLAIYALSSCNLYTGSIEEVIPVVEQAIRLSPRDPYIGRSFFRIGLVHLLQSRTDEAILWFEKGRGTSPEHPNTHAYLASAHALKGETELAAAELAEARRLSADGRYASVARLRASQYLGVPKIRALFEATYFAGLRKAGMPEE